jgi:hypothetical protein
MARSAEDNYQISHTITPPGKFPAAPENATKGRRWMLALQRQVAATWLATLDNVSGLCRTHGPELDIEPVGVELAFALIAVRVLDLTVFNGGPDQDYQTHRSASDEGQVVDGMTLMRNAEVHLGAVVDPGVDRALSVPPWFVGQPWPFPVHFRGQFRLFPSWRPFDELPREVRETERTHQRCKDNYREHVGGKLVLDTLLDAVRFFYECDPSIAATDEEGALLHFPLPVVLPVSGDRLHPLGS